MQKSGHMILKGVNWIHIDTIKSNGFERNQFGTKCKNWVVWSCVMYNSTSASTDETETK